LASFEQKQGYGLIRIHAAILVHLANPSMTKSEKKNGNAAIKAPLALLRPKNQFRLQAASASSGFLADQYLMLRFAQGSVRIE
jgi:hypothetical protein